MDLFLSKVTQQAMNYAIRSGITITASYAIQQSTRLLKKAGDVHRDELQRLQDRLQSKIQIISPAIDMIELIAARGNTSLESAVALTQGLRLDIQDLGRKLAKIVGVAEVHGIDPSSRRRAQLDAEIKIVIKAIRNLLSRIEDAVPLINLAITTSGAKLSTSLPATVSPSRLLQASAFLTGADTQYSVYSTSAVQVGPTFTLSVYLLFAGHIRPQDEQGVRETSWKEVIHKARVKLRRIPMERILQEENGGCPNGDSLRDDAKTDEFAYEMLIIEDLDDGRVHDVEEGGHKPGPFDNVALAGIRETIPIHQISKIFYADTGKILNIGSEGEANNPVLLLKRDVNAIPPRRMINRQASLDYVGPNVNEDALSKSYGDEQSQLDAQLQAVASPREPQDYHPEGESSELYRFPPGLDLEWIAFEVFQDDVGADDEDDADDGDADNEDQQEPTPRDTGSRPADPEEEQLLTEKMGKLHMNSPRGLSNQKPSSSTISHPLFNSIKTSLSLLEILLRLTSLQQFQQQSILSITDELLNFFLEESSTTGAGGDEQHRQLIRAEARRKVGWDPYDESPLKRRGEDYLYQGSDTDQSSWAGSPSRRQQSSPSGFATSRRYSGSGPPSSPSSPSARGSKKAVDLRRQIPSHRLQGKDIPTTVDSADLSS
ncbi:hypothetical protein FQN57_003999 [Myotisia sp. PD_48]|nr:hypothetical protein FQN57_003999 [Myotisia sp. PD_48]